MPRARLFLRFAAVFAAALAAACRPNGDFPSLEPRAIEREDPLEEPVRTPPAVPSDPALRARAAELASQARQGERDFEAALGSASAAARRAGSPGSEGWVVAQQQISRAEAARAPTSTALAELDRLAAERARMATDEGDFEAVRSALDEAERLSAGQQQRLDRLRASIRR